MACDGMVGSGMDWYGTIPLDSGSYKVFYRGLSRGQECFHCSPRQKDSRKRREKDVSKPSRRKNASNATDRQPTPDL
jgi:hypothetical protein